MLMNSWDGCAEKQGGAHGHSPQAGRGPRGVAAEKPRSAATNHARTHATIKSCGASASASSSAALLAGARVPRAVDIGGDSGTLACVGASWEGRQAGVGGGRRGTLPRQAGKRNARAFLRVDHTRGQVPSQHSCRRQPWWPQLASRHRWRPAADLTAGRAGQCAIAGGSNAALLGELVPQLRQRKRHMHTNLTAAATISYRYC